MKQKKVERRCRKLIHMLTDSPDLTASEAAQRLHCTTAQVHYIVGREDLETCKVPGRPMLVRGITAPEAQEKLDAIEAHDAGLIHWR